MSNNRKPSAQRPTYKQMFSQIDIKSTDPVAPTSEQLFTNPFRNESINDSTSGFKNPFERNRSIFRPSSVISNGSFGRNGISSVISLNSVGVGACDDKTIEEKVQKSLNKSGINREFLVKSNTTFLNRTIDAEDLQGKLLFKIYL